MPHVFSSTLFSNACIRWVLYMESKAWFFLPPTPPKKHTPFFHVKFFQFKQRRAFFPQPTQPNQKKTQQNNTTHPVEPLFFWAQFIDNEDKCWKGSNSTPLSANGNQPTPGPFMPSWETETPWKLPGFPCFGGAYERDNGLHNPLTRA